MRIKFEEGIKFIIVGEAILVFGYEIIFSFTFNSFFFKLAEYIGVGSVTV